MQAADSWEKLSDALLGPFERDIIDGLTGAYRALEPRIEVAYKRALEGADDFPLQRLLILRQQLEQELQTMTLPPQLRQTVNQALLDGQKAADFWALAELNKVKQEASKLTPDQAAAVFADAVTDPAAILSPGMVQQNPSALIAAAQRQNALASYAAGGKGTQAFATLNRLVEVDLRGRIIGGVEFHLASGDSWRQLRKTLQNSVELSKSRAQTVARTEMAAAMVEGSKLRYEAEGIDQVQWQAVGSSRTCGYCAPRHGKVYRLGDVVAPAHPNCRCGLTPWDPEWEELGLIDPQEEAQSRAAVLADLEAAGKQPISGPTPFEKSLGMEQAPEALWSPPRVLNTDDQQRLAKDAAKTFVKQNSFAMPSTRFTGEDVGEMVDDIIQQIPDSNMRKLFDFVEKDGQVLFVSETEQGLAKRLGVYGVRDFTKADLPWAVGDQYKSQLRKALGDQAFSDEKFHSDRLPQLVKNEKILKDKIATAKAKGFNDTISKNALKNVRRDLRQSREYIEDLPRRYGSHALASIADGQTSPYARRVILADDKNELLHSAFEKDRKVNAEDLRRGISETLRDRANGVDVSGRLGASTYDARRYGGRKESVAYTYTHETGHQVFFRAGSPQPPRLAGNAPTGYAELNADELFAESWAAYVFDPNGLRRFDAGLYDWVDQTYATAMQKAGGAL